jgi:hypothetical protein
MFLENSRYFGQKTMTVTLADGRVVQALQPRRLPSPPASPRELKGHERLDLIAEHAYEDGTKFWHIADANTAVEARLLPEPAPANTVTPPAVAIMVPDK